MKVIVVLMLVSLAVAKPAFEFEDIDEDWIRNLVQEDPSSTPQAVFTTEPPTGTTEPPTGTTEPPTGTTEPPTGTTEPPVYTTEPPVYTTEPPTGTTERPPKPGPKPTKEPKDIPLFAKFFHYLYKVSVGNVKPDEPPDLKYKKPGEKLVKKLLKVREAVIEALKPIHEIAKLMIEDHKDMMRRVKEAVDKDDIYQAQYIVGEYFIALNRRFVGFFIHAEQMGLFRKIDEDKDDDDMKRVRREVKKAMDDHGKEAAEFILKNFNEFRVSDGLPDRPFVKLGIETAVVLIRTFKQMEKVVKISMKVYIDMVSDIVRLALKEHNHKGAVHRAGAGVLSMVRRQTKVGIALHRIYNQKKCFAKGRGKGPGGKGKDSEGPKGEEKDKKPEEKEDDGFYYY